jgi:hypothetical protein
VAVGRAVAGGLPAGGAGGAVGAELAEPGRAARSVRKRGVVGAPPAPAGGAGDRAAVRLGRPPHQQSAGARRDRDERQERRRLLRAAAGRLAVPAPVAGQLRLPARPQRRQHRLRQPFAPGSSRNDG